MMINKEKRRHDWSSLRQTPLLEPVSNQTLRQIERDAKYVCFAKGREIITPADELNDVFLLLSGSARVIVFSASGKAVNFRRVDPGDLFGEFSAIDGQHRSASVEAVEPCTALCMNPVLFLDLMKSDPDFMRGVLSHLVSLLRSMTGRIVEFSTLAVTSRIHTELLRMARAAYDDDKTYEIKPSPTHSEIAGRISTHREAVSREISRLKQLGVLERRGRSLIVKDLQYLERMVAEASGD